jgi:NAD(P)-dependent dehydrogenase (short-subunit alcohol dehydrogenase family)
MTANLFDLTGKVALVTGGSRGLGLQMVRAFAENGADVIIVSRKIEACEAAAQEARAMGRRALALSAHVGEWRRTRSARPCSTASST